MVQTPSIPYFKGLDMRNLQYEIRICQKIHNNVTMTVYVMVRFLMKQTLYHSSKIAKVGPGSDVRPDYPPVQTISSSPCLTLFPLVRDTSDPR
jgi:hypothetical protein